MSSEKFVKLRLRREIRKFKITNFTSPYDEVIGFVNNQFTVGENIRLSYHDDDGDEITVSSNREVIDAMQGGRVVKFSVRCEGADEEETQPDSPVMKENTMLHNTTMRVLLEETQMEQLQNEVDQRVTGQRRAKFSSDERITVPNVFTTFDNRVLRQFEVGTSGVCCTICPLPKCPKPTTDFSNLRAHGRSETHQHQLTFQVTGQNDHVPRTLEYPLSWRLGDRTAAQLLAAKYHHFASSSGQRRKRTAFSPATTLALEEFSNSINWKRGESDKINEFAQAHNLTFYQVKVWMNNHRPRKNSLNFLPHKHFLPSTDLSKVIQALGGSRTDGFSLQNLKSGGLQYNLHSSPVGDQCHSSAFTNVSCSPEQEYPIFSTSDHVINTSDHVTNTSDVKVETCSTQAMSLSSKFPTTGAFSGELSFSNGLLGNSQLSQMFQNSEGTT